MNKENIGNPRVTVDRFYLEMLEAKSEMKGSDGWRVKLNSDWVSSRTDSSVENYVLNKASLSAKTPRTYDEYKTAMESKTFEYSPDDDATSIYARFLPEWGWLGMDESNRQIVMPNSVSNGEKSYGESDIQESMDKVLRKKGLNLSDISIRVVGSDGTFEVVHNTPFSEQDIILDTMNYTRIQELLAEGK
jgi:hypothetical protein